MFGSMAVRDALIASTIVLAWWLAAPLSAGNGPLADSTGALLGIGAGVIGHLAHEWGHLVGALLTGARVGAPPRLTSPFLFSFDSKRNSQRQFVLMSLSGFAVTGIALVLVYTLLPDGWLATRVARGLIVFGASLTLVLEVPLLVVSVVSGSIVAAVEVFPIRAAPTPAAAPATDRAA